MSEFEQTTSSNGFSLEMLLQILWRGKLVIIVSTIIFAVSGVLYALSLPNIYRSDALLVPVNQEGGGMGGIASQFGGLASLAGVNLSSGGADKTSIGIEVLRSRKFVKEFIEKYQIASEVFAAIAWDKGTNTITYDDEIYDANKKSWVKDENGIDIVPSDSDIYKTFVSQLNVSQDVDTSFVVLSFEHVSPILAQQIVSNLINEINKNIMMRDVNQAEKSIDYLQEQVKQNQLAELKAGLFELIQSQTETIMLASASPEYLFQIIDPPIVPEKRVRPKRAVIAVLSTILGAILGGLIAISIGLYRYKRHSMI